MTNLHTVRRISIVSLTFVCALIVGVDGCGSRTSSPAIPLGAPNDAVRAAALMAQLDPAGVNVTGSGPWKSVPLGYTPTTLVSAALSANSSVWFADQNANIIGEVTAAGATTRYDAGSFAFPNPTGTPTMVQAHPADIEAGPNGTTYYLADYGYGVMSAGGTPNLFFTYCYDPTIQCNAPINISPPETTQMAVSSDGSAWFGAVLYPTPSQPEIVPVVARALGSSVTAIPVPGWTGQQGQPATLAPSWLTIGPDGNVWFSDGQAIGTINVATNAVTMHNIPAQYINAQNGWAGDITSGPEGVLWVSYVNQSSYLLRVSTSGVISGVLDPTAGLDSGFNGDGFSHGLTGGSKNTLYAANGDWLISSFNATTSQFSTYNWPNQGIGGGAQTITAGADSNMWVFQSNYPKTHVFFPHSTISSTPAAFKMKVGTTATVNVKEGKYTGMFTSASPQGCGASATPPSSPGTFTIEAGSTAGPPCFLSFADTIGNGTAYVKVTVTR